MADDNFTYKDQLKKIGYEKGKAESSQKIKKLENFIDRLKARKSKSKPKTSKEDKILDPGARLKELKRIAKTNELIKKYKFSQGKVGRLLAFAERQRKITRSLSPERKAQLKRMVMMRQAQQPQNIALGWEAHYITPALEREVLNAGGSGSLASEGDRAAVQVGRETSLFGNLSTPLPVRQVEREANFHAAFQHLSPVLNIENEVNSFANILNPRQPKARGRKK